MVYLVAGLILFLGVHSVRIVADGWRARTLASVGEGTYKGLFSIASVLGLGLIVYGFGVARETPPYCGHRRRPCATPPHY